MLRLVVIVAVLLLIVYFLRAFAHARMRPRTMRRMPQERGRVIEGEPPQVRDAREFPHERDPRT
jgi:hypothetical protein